VTLILFDIDGTLTATNEVDAKCYATAFQRTFGRPLPTTDWDVYVFVTDTGIIHEVLEAERGSRATAAEIAAFERAFVEALEAEYAVNPGGFAEIPGAKAVLDAIEARSGMQAAIATGGMRGSGTYKLSRIGVDAPALPGGFSNDDDTREGVARCAVARADALAGAHAATHDLVYVGDGPWDVRTSAAVGMRFIGISGDASGERLYAEGASVCLENYLDQDAFFRAVEDARVPCPPKQAGAGG